MDKNAMDKSIHADPSIIATAMESEVDAQLLTVANTRMATFDPEHLVSSDDFWHEFNITKEDLESVEVDFE